MEIREGREADISRLRSIYNHYVEHTHITFDTEPRTLAERRTWLSGFHTEGPHRLLVLVADGEVQGYASSSVFRGRPAYDRSVEASVYLAPECAGRGFGSALYEELFAVLQAEPNVHRVYGGIALPNEASVALHQRFGFKQVGQFSEVGFKFGRYWDVVWFERAI